MIYKGTFFYLIGQECCCCFSVWVGNFCEFSHGIVTAKKKKVEKFFCGLKNDDND